MNLCLGSSRPSGKPLTTSSPNGRLSYAVRPLAFAALVVLLSCGRPVQAEPIHPDLRAFGQYLYDEDSSGVAGWRASQDGTIFARQGGDDATVVYEDDDVFGTNPISAIFTEHGGGVVGAGDGFGGTGTAAAYHWGDFRADTDQTPSDGVTPFVMMNDSVDTYFLIEMSLTYDHFVSTRKKSYVRSDLELDLNGESLFDSEIESYRGRRSDSDAGVFTFSFLLAPGDVAEMELDYTFEGYADKYNAYAGGESSYFLSIDNVQQVVPEPASIGMFSAVFLVLGLTRSKRRRSTLSDSKTT